jgi:SPP1 family predicted phage head-tail adaptor
MQIGRLRHRITIEQATVTRDAYGGETLTWGTYATIWALVTPVRGQERQISAAAQELATLAYQVRMRYRSDIDPRMRVVWGTKVLDIESIYDPTGRYAELILLCRDVLEGVAP